MRLDLLGLMVVHASIVAAQAATPLPPEIVTSGAGRVTLPADRAVVRVSVATRAMAASEASAANGPLVARVQDTLRTLGLVDRDARVVSFGVSPTYENEDSRPRLSGYEARSALELNVRNVPALGRVLDATLGAGATEVNSITFVSDTAVAAKRVALRNALNTARDEAQALAVAAGGRLGALKSMSTSPDGGGLYRGYALEEMVVTGAISAARGSIPAVQRDVVVAANVYARWIFIPTP